MILSIALAFLLAQTTPQPAPNNQMADPNQKPPEKCTIEGKVVNAVTGEPLRKATLVLFGSDKDTNGLNFSASTDANGIFTVKDVDPGKYRMTAQRAGFVQQSFGAKRSNSGGAVLSLQPGQAMKEVVFRMWPHAVITGRVVDSDGEPVPWVSVTVARTMWQGTQKRMQDMGNSQTNDLGEYRIFGVAPGRYYLKGTMNGYMTMGAGGSEPEDYAPVFYPGVSDARSAVMLDVQAGQIMRGIDMTVTKVPTRRIRGKILSTIPGKPDFLRLMLMPRDTGGYGGPVKSIQVQPAKSTFELRAAPGSYNLVASRTEGSMTATARTPVDVTDSDLENVVITIQPPAEIQGHLRIEGASDLTVIAQSPVRLQASPREPGPMFGGMGAGRVGDDGAFTLKNVGAEPVNVNVIGLPAGYYVKSMTYGQQNVKVDGLAASGSSDSLQVVVSPNGAAVDGTVRNKSGDPVTGATVVLVPPSDLRDSARNFRIGATDQTGHFTFTGLEPLKYTLYAWEDVESGAFFDPDFLKPIENRGKKLDLKESGHETVDVDVVPADETALGRN